MSLHVFKLATDLLFQKIKMLENKKISFQPKEKKKCKLTDGSGQSQQGNQVSSRFDDVNDGNL